MCSYLFGAAARIINFLDTVNIITSAMQLVCGLQMLRCTISILKDCQLAAGASCAALTSSTSRPDECVVTRIQHHPGRRLNSCAKGDRLALRTSKSLPCSLVRNVTVAPYYRDVRHR